MKIEKLMTKNVITVQINASAYDAVKLMNKKGIGCLVAVHEGRIVGILTERDLLKRVLQKCKDPKKTAVSEIMTRHVIVGKPNMQLVEATRLMFENNVKKLPIAKRNELVGLVTLTDIARATNVDKETIKLVETLSNIHMI